MDTLIALVVLLVVAYLLYHAWQILCFFAAFARACWLTFRQERLP